MTGVRNHVKHASGRRKNVCTSAVLAAFGISPDSYHYAQDRDDVKRILRRNGFSVRSRLSSIPKNATIGTLRTWLRRNAEPNAWYYVGVDRHAMLLDGTGRTVVDTAPRQRDRRRVVHVSMVRHAR